MIYLKTNDNITQIEDTAIMLGNFDGIHLGHQSLYAKLSEISHEKGYKKVVFSFFPHPSQYFTNKTFQTLLISEEKSRLFKEMGVDIFVEFTFSDECAKMEPEDFVKNILFTKMKCKTLIVGEDYHFGNNQKGDYELLLNIGKKLGMEVIAVPTIMLENVKISSRLIREYVVKNDFKNTEISMGRPYFAMGTVAPGHKIGRTLGFPTVNILPTKNKLLPENGVYITKTKYKDKIMNSVTNIGFNPTIDNAVKTTEKRIETYIFDFDQDIYHEEITVYFYKWIRNEIKFENFEQLKNRIAQDVLEGKNYFNEKG